MWRTTNGFWGGMKFLAHSRKNSHCFSSFPTARYTFSVAGRETKAIWSDLSHASDQMAFVFFNGFMCNILAVVRCNLLMRFLCINSLQSLVRVPQCLSQLQILETKESFCKDGVGTKFLPGCCETKDSPKTQWDKLNQPRQSYLQGIHKQSQNLLPGKSGSKLVQYHFCHSGLNVKQ